MTDTAVLESAEDAGRPSPYVAGRLSSQAAETYRFPIGGLVLCALGALALLVLASMISSFYVVLLIQILIYGILAMSLDLLVGYTGQSSLAQIAYFGTSAYVSAILAINFHLPFYLTCPAGIVFGLLTAATSNVLALRTSGSYYLMFTMALSQALWSLATAWSSVTGGDNGLGGFKRPDMSWFPISLDPDYGLFVVCLIVFLACATCMYIIVNSPFGYVLRGIRENEGRMQALGYNTWRYKYLISIFAAFFAAVAGQLFMYQDNFISPSMLSVATAAQILLMILVGAAGTLFGPVVGAALLILLQNIVASYTARWLLVMGAIYVLVALFAPKGVLPPIIEAIARLRRNRA